MVQHKYIGLLIFLILFACHGENEKTALLHRAALLVQEFPDSALCVLESIPHPETLSASDRVDYSLLLIHARSKAHAYALGDSLSQAEVHACTSALLQQELAERYKLEAMFLLLFVATGGAVYFWVDKCRRKRLLELERQLEQRRTDILSVYLMSENGAAPDSIEVLASNLELCFQSFRRTEVYEQLLFLERKVSAVNSLSVQDRQVICESIYEHFGDVMLKLKTQYADLTKEDTLYCVFFLLGCSKETILRCTRVSEGAFKSRKCRIKEKLGKEFFSWWSSRYRIG